MFFRFLTETVDNIVTLSGGKLFFSIILALDKIDISAKRIINLLFTELQTKPELRKYIDQTSIRKFGLLFVQWNEDEHLCDLLTLGSDKMDPGYQYDTIAMIINSLQSRGKEAMAKQFRKHLPSIVPAEG